MTYNKKENEMATTTTETYNDIEVNDPRVQLPLPPEAGDETRFEMEIYARFMRHLRNVPNSRMEIKILSAIQFTSDMMDTSDALISKILSDQGLRAPRKSYPVTFLDFVDKSVARTNWELGVPPRSIVALKNHWDNIGENPFTHTTSGHYSVANEANLARV